MMNYEQVTTSYVDAESYPWVPFVPYSDRVFLKVLKCEPVSGTFVTLLKAPAEMVLPKHHHCGTVMVYTIEGQWKYSEHDWIAQPGSFVYETAASSHTPEGYGEGDVITLNVQVGDSIYLNDDGSVMAIENWKTMLDRYLDYCRDQGIEPVDITSFEE